MNVKIRSIRIVPIALLILLSLTNLYLGLITYPKVGFVNYLIFSLVYLVLGLILMSRIPFAELIGFISAIAILFIYPVIINFNKLHPWSSGAMSSFNAIIIISCGILLLLKIKD